ncbi:MAG: thioesterase family protein [Pseudomonadota bacterium]
MADFSSLVASGAFDGAQFTLEISDDWMQGRTTYGGMSSALCLETAMRVFPDLPPLRSAMVSFIGPAGGKVTGEARILRQGKSVTFVEADLIAEKGLATRAIFVFGAERESRLNDVYVKAPDLPAPDECEMYSPDGFGPGFFRQFDTRLAKGARIFAGADEQDHWLWVRHRDSVATGPVALLALADAPPPAAAPMLSEIAMNSSVTWQVNFIGDGAYDVGDWRLIQTRAEAAAGGYSSQDMSIWNFDRTLLATMRQSVAIFA